MKITLLTISPDEFAGLKKDHVVSRAISLGKLELSIMDIRDYADGCFRKVDDSPYGGGPGMILRIEPVMKALEHALQDTDPSGTIVAALSPTGEMYTQKTAEQLASCSHLILICGHYEGMDERIYSHADRIISIGSYILSGGEIAAMAITDSVVRLLPGVIREESLLEESFEGGMLEYPQYTRPADYHGEKVPAVLLSGNHEAIKKWRRASMKSVQLPQ